MRGANILTEVAVAVWLGMSLIGLSLLMGVNAQQLPGYPNGGQVRFLFVYPIAVAAFLAASAWLSNRFARWLPLLGCLSDCALFAALPYFIGFGGGV